MSFIVTRDNWMIYLIPRNKIKKAITVTSQMKIQLRFVKSAQIMIQPEFKFSLITTEFHSTHIGKLTPLNLLIHEVKFDS